MHAHLVQFDIAWEDPVANRDRVMQLVDAVAPTAGDLVEWLKTRSPRHAEALANSKVVKVAVNQEHVPYDHPISPTDEVALFPPVTGG